MEGRQGRFATVDGVQCTIDESSRPGRKINDCSSEILTQVSVIRTCGNRHSSYLRSASTFCGNLLFRHTSRPGQGCWVWEEMRNHLCHKRTRSDGIDPNAKIGEVIAQTFSKMIQGSLRRIVDIACLSMLIEAADTAHDNELTLDVTLMVRAVRVGIAGE